MIQFLSQNPHTYNKLSKLKLVPNHKNVTIKNYYSITSTILQLLLHF